MNEEETQERDEVARANREALSALVAKHKLFMRQKDYDKWRPTVETTGSIAGLWHLGQLRCIATDGLQAYFVRRDGSTFTGHVGHFQWDAPVVSMVPYLKEDGSQGWFKSVKDSGAPAALFRKTPVAKPRREAKPKLSLVEKALALLEKLQARSVPGKEQ